MPHASFSSRHPRGPHSPPLLLSWAPKFRIAQRARPTSHPIPRPERLESASHCKCTPSRTYIIVRCSLLRTDLRRLRIFFHLFSLLRSLLLVGFLSSIRLFPSIGFLRSLSGSCVGLAFLTRGFGSFSRCWVLHERHAKPFSASSPACDFFIFCRSWLSRIGC